MDVVILCGGRGTRFHPETVETPKPLVELGGRPIVEHVMDVYATQIDSPRFVLACGYLIERFRERYEHDGVSGREITVLDTGDDSGTGERLRRARRVIGPGTFLATYGDGLADVDIEALLACHRRLDLAATLTTVPLPSQYGTVDIVDGRVSAFREKPILRDHWINGGFFAFEHAALDVPGQSLEDDVMPALAADGQVGAHHHDGFWRSMDTFKDRQALEELVDEHPWSR